MPTEKLGVTGIQSDIARTGVDIDGRGANWCQPHTVASISRDENRQSVAGPHNAPFGIVNEDPELASIPIAFERDDKGALLGVASPEGEGAGSQGKSRLEIGAIKCPARVFEMLLEFHTPRAKLAGIGGRCSHTRGVQVPLGAQFPGDVGAVRRPARILCIYAASGPAVHAGRAVVFHALPDGCCHSQGTATHENA